MNWNPMMGQPWDGGLMPQQGMPAQSPDFGALAQAFAQQQPMGGGLPENTLGASGVTLGNPHAQDQYAEMAQALAQHNRAQQQQDMAAAMMQPKYAENSGGLGSLAMMVQAYAGKKMAKRASADDADARERYYKGEAAAEEAKAAREQARAQADVARKLEILQRGDPNEILANGIELPKGERGVPMMTDQGLVIVDPYSGGYRSASPEGQQQSGTMQGRNGAFNVSDDLPPEVRAQIIAAEQGNGKVPDDLGLVRQQPQQRPLMPYRDPEQAQRQAAADARAERADQRAERALQFQQGQAARKPENAKAENAASLRGAQIGNVERGISRIEQALNALEGNTFADTGVVDQWITGQTDQGRELKAAVGAIQNSMLGLTRVPGVGSQSDLEAKIAALQYPSLDMPMETNRKTVENLRALIRDLGGQQAPQAGNNDDLVNKYLRP